MTNRQLCRQCKYYVGLPTIRGGRKVCRLVCDSLADWDFGEDNTDETAERAVVNSPDFKPPLDCPYYLEHTLLGDIPCRN